MTIRQANPDAASTYCPANKKPGASAGFVMWADD